MSQPDAIVFPHFPKTGGTTVLYHFRKYFGDSQIQLVGPHGRTMRFFANMAQLEEEAENKIAKYKVFQGHGVNEVTAATVAAAGVSVKLMVVLRHPVGLSRSRYNHRAKHVAENGGILQSTAFLNGDPDNVMCRMLLKNFPSFVDDESASLSERTISILSKFDYVFTTENLDKQVAYPMQYFNLPASLERRRVAEKKLNLDATDEELCTRHSEDLNVFTSINKLIKSDGSDYNAIGFDAAGKFAALERASLLNCQAVESAYIQLCQGLCTELKAEAALEKLLNEKNSVALKDLELFEALLRKKWGRTSEQLRPLQKKNSAHHLEVYRRSIA